MALGQKFLAVYSGVLTAVFAGTAIYGFAPGRTDEAFREITVERINVVEPDGTIRAVFTNSVRTPGIFRKGVEGKRDDPNSAGIYFMNDEGSENGGLIWGGSRSANGAIENHGHLSFDQYGGTQVLATEGWEQDGQHASRMLFWDQRGTDGETGKTRLSIGKNPDRSVGLHVKDAEGRNRILLDISPAGDPQLVFLGADGHEVARLPNNKG